MLSAPFTAEDALSWGIVGRLVPEDELAATVREVASGLAAGPTLAYAAAKRAIRQAWASPWPDVLAAEARDQAALARPPTTGARWTRPAKRPPEFRGRE